MTVPCNGCALTDGACANQEPHNQLRAKICVRAGLPFYCHDTRIADWRDAIAFKVAILSRRPIPICRGWAREVARLAATGYFTRARALKRRLGEAALSALERFISTDEGADPYEKANAREDMETAISILFAPEETETPAS
jgi:hypothetical protein